MKKIIMLLILITFLISTGCNNGAIGVDTTDGKTQVTEKNTEEPTEAPVVSLIPTTAKETDITGLYKLETNISHSSLSTNAQINDGVLRLEFVSPGLYTVSMKIVNYSLTEDKTLGEIDLAEGNWQIGNLKDGGFYAVSLITSEVKFYDKNCKETFSKKIFDKDYWWSYVSISDDGKNILYNKAIDGSLFLYSLDTGKEAIIGDAKGVFIPIGYRDGYFYLSNYETGISKVSPEDKKLEPIIKNELSGLLTTEYSIGDSNSYFIISPLDNVENRKMTPMNNRLEIPIAANDKYFATTISDEKGNKLRLYNVKDSKVTPELTVPGFIQKVEFYSQDLMFIICHDTVAQKNLYYLYDLTKLDNLKDIVIEKADDKILYSKDLPDWTGEADTINRAKEILDKYNLRIVYGESSNIDSERFLYSHTPVDDKVAFANMDRIEDLLKYFPEGMIEELGCGEQLMLYLCTNITHVNNKSYIGGLAQTYNNNLIIFIDVDCSDTFFKETLVHEISHIMDYSIDYKLLQGWVDLMPSNIATKAYANSYTTNVDLSYTPYNSNGSEVWFYDSYSKTFPTEDRAVIFQKMYISHVNGEMTYDFKNYPNLKKKAKYYAEMIRETFDSCKNAKTLPWEEPFIEK